MSGQPLLHELMLVRTAAVPQQDDEAAHMACEMTQEAEDLRPPNVEPGIQGPGEGDPTTARRHHEGADPGALFYATGRARSGGALPARGPGAPKHRPHHEAGFIEADQVGAEAVEYAQKASGCLTRLWECRAQLSTRRRRSVVSLRRFGGIGRS